MATAPQPAQSTYTPRSTIDLPPFIYGTAWKDEETANLVHAGLDNGFRALDTAAQPRHYREDLVGQGIEDYLSQDHEGVQVRREDLWVSLEPSTIVQSNPCPPLDMIPTLQAYAAHNLLRSRPSSRLSTATTTMLGSPTPPPLPSPPKSGPPSSPPSPISPSPPMTPLRCPTSTASSYIPPSPPSPPPSSPGAHSNPSSLTASTTLEYRT